MGLFFNYNKVGPGVSKNEPKKKSFWQFFELLGRNFWKLVTANVWTVLLTTPVLTYGLAQAGITYVTRAMTRDRHVFVTSDFFEAIKKNWKQALSIGIIDLIVTAIFIFDLYFFLLNSKSTWGLICLALSIFIAVMYLFSSYYRYMICVTFDFKLSQIYKNSFLLSVCGFVRNIITTVSILLVYAITIALGFITGKFGMMILILLWFSIIPALCSFIIQFVNFPVVLKFMVEPYYAEHPDEDIEKRRELGLLPYEEPDEDVNWGEK